MLAQVDAVEVGEQIVLGAHGGVDPAQVEPGWCRGGHDLILPRGTDSSRGGAGTVPRVPKSQPVALALEAEAGSTRRTGEILMEAAAAGGGRATPRGPVCCWRGSSRRRRGRLLCPGGTGGAADRGAPDEALARLAELARDPALHDGHCQWAAELLAEHGQPREALRWYDRLVARMAPDRPDAVREADGWLAMESIALRGRREVRRELGLPPDATDEIVPDPPEGGLDAMLERLAGLERRTPHRAVERVLIFQRAERAEAHRRWPDDYDDDPGHYAEVERRRRAHAEAGGRAVIVPGTVAELVAFAEAHGGSPLDEEVRKRYCASIADARTLTWPPARNAPCWCGTGVKYKKCCGRPGNG